MDNGYDTAKGPSASRKYHVIALEVPIVFNFYGDYDPNGLIFALERNKEQLDNLREEIKSGDHSRWLSVPHPLVRPLVLRARVGETVEIVFENHIRERRVGIHLIADRYDVTQSDGAHVGINPSSLAGPPEGPPDSNKRTYIWHCVRDGVFPFHDAGNLSGGEDGTNVHGLFGALVVEPAEAAWSDPITGERLDEPLPDASGYWGGDGLYVDVHPAGWIDLPDDEKKSFEKCPSKYALEPENSGERPPSFREYVIFFHDEPEFMPSPGPLEPEPCPDEMHTGRHGRGGCHGDGTGCHCRCGCHHGEPCPICCRCHGDDRHGCHRCCCHGRHSRHRCRSCRGVDEIFGGHRRRGGSEHEGPLPIMPISYRAEPLVNREQKLWRMIRQGTLQKPVIGEEQHHSSWLFGDPATPVLRAYVGDPIRIRLVHGAVKETHVFHQHVYQWHADPQNRNSPIIDSVTISPQTAHTIDFLFGAGSRQGAIGDAIFHCHLYPHFHEGMWGIMRTFDRLQDGTGKYPHNDQTPEELITIEALQPLRDRRPPRWPSQASRPSSRANSARSRRSRPGRRFWGRCRRTWTTARRPK